MSEQRFYMSPVDYEAWRNGYMPPTEHVLIHKLSVGEVKVVACSDHGDTGWWLVVKDNGKRSTKVLKAASRFLHETIEFFEDDERALPSPNEGCGDRNP